jgi:hypothetical protein
LKGLWDKGEELVILPVPAKSRPGYPEAASLDR